MMEYLQNLNIFDKILSKVFSRYTNKIYRLGVMEGFNWENEKKMGKIKKIKILINQVI